MWYRQEIRRYINGISDWKFLRMIYTIAKTLFFKAGNASEPETNYRDLLDTILDVLPETELETIYHCLNDTYQITAEQVRNNPDNVKIFLDGRELTKTP